MISERCPEWTYMPVADFQASRFSLHLGVTRWEVADVHDLIGDIGDVEVDERGHLGLLLHDGWHRSR